LHGDVKPDNILLAGNKLYIADFGFATFKPITCAEKVEMLGGTASYGMTLDDPHVLELHLTEHHQAHQRRSKRLVPLLHLIFGPLVVSSLCTPHGLLQARKALSALQC
jgi:serine/threonine protein kinase